MSNRVFLSPGYYPNPDKSRSLSGAQIFVGIVDLDPTVEANQKQISVVRECGESLEVSQPIFTNKGGVPQYNGVPVTITVEGSYSLAVLDSEGEQVYYVPNNTENSGDTVKTIDELRELTGAFQDQSIKVLGYYTAGDGGGGPTRIWDEGQAVGYYTAITGTEPENGGSIIVPNGGDGSAAWVFNAPEIYAEWFGAIADGATDNTASFNAIISYFATENVTTSGGTLRLSTGIYLTDPLVITEGRISIIGTGINSVLMLNDSSNSDLLTIQGGFTNIERIQLDGNRANQTSGGCISLDNTNSFVSLRNMRCTEGKGYGASFSGVGQVSIDNTQFLLSGIGCIITNCQAVDIFGGSTFEDNDTIGLRLDGSSTVMTVKISGCYFENNAAFGVSPEGWHIYTDAFQSKSKLTISGSYFNGVQSSLVQWGIRFGSSTAEGFDGNTITGNLFQDCDNGAFDNNVTAANTGHNDLQFNTITGTTPPIERMFGFMTSGSQEIHILSGELDLSAAGLTLLELPLLAPTMIRIKSAGILYTEATSADAGINIRIGIVGTAAQFYSQTSEINKAVNTFDDITSTLTTTTLNSLTQKTLTVFSNGNKVGTGNIKFDILLIAY